MKRKIPKHPRWGMSYENRIRGYEREKDELFFKTATMTQAEIDKAYKDLREKWGI